MQENTRWGGISSFSLHLMAMAFMLCDHLWATVLAGHDWLTCIGRIAFPIFAFMIVEGYFRTRDLKKYVLRLLVCALISEIPFNLMMGSSLFYPVHQNVLWTFLLGIAMIWINEKARSRGKLWLSILAGVGTAVLGGVLGLVTMVDYFSVGVLTVLVFYFFRGRKWWCYVGQLAALYWLNVELLGGLGYELEIFGHQFFLVQQGLALLALIPIWLYRGKQGYHSRGWQMACYLFYPVHILILGLVYMYR